MTSLIVAQVIQMVKFWQYQANNTHIYALCCISIPEGEYQALNRKIDLKLAGTRLITFAGVNHNLSQLDHSCNR
jgi:hypothetical protein